MPIDFKLILTDFFSFSIFSLFSWWPAADKNIPAIPDFVIPLNPADSFFGWKKAFFTPGMQLFGQKIGENHALKKYEQLVLNNSCF